MRILSQHHQDFGFTAGHRAGLTPNEDLVKDEEAPRSISSSSLRKSRIAFWVCDISARTARRLMRIFVSGTASRRV